MASVINGYFNSESNEMVFWTNHLSIYGVLYKTIDFIDFANYTWAEHAAEVMAAKGVTNGTGGRNFSPARTITRTEFVTM